LCIYHIIIILNSLYSKELDTAATSADSSSLICDIGNHGYDKLPTLSFAINGTSFSLSPQDYFIGKVLAIDAYSLNGTTSLVFMLGDLFIRQFYIVFDLTSESVLLGKPRVATAGLYSAIPEFVNHVNANKSLSVPIENPLSFYNPAPISTFLETLPSLELTLDAHKKWQQQQSLHLPSPLSVSKSNGHARLYDSDKNDLFIGSHSNML